MELLTAQDLAKELKLTVDTIWRYTRMGRIPVVRVSARDYRYRLTEVLASLAVDQTGSPQKTPCLEGHLRPIDSDELRGFIGRLTKQDTP